MKLARWRFTVRGMMVGVAVVGVAIGGSIEIARLRQFSHIYWVKSRRFAGRERMVGSGATLSHEAWVAQVRHVERTEREMDGWFKMARPYSPERCGRLIPYFEALRLKYERAARFPWLPVKPDSPMPECTEGLNYKRRLTVSSLSEPRSVCESGSLCGINPRSHLHC